MPQDAGKREEFCTYRASEHISTPAMQKKRPGGAGIGGRGGRYMRQNASGRGGELAFLADRLSQVIRELDCAYMNFNSAGSSETVDASIYEINALQAQYAFYLKKAKAEYSGDKLTERKKRNRRTCTVAVYRRFYRLRQAAYHKRKTVFAKHVKRCNCP